MEWADDQLSELNKRERALGEVKNRSLATPLQVKHALQVHRMTQSAIAHVMKPSETSKWFNNAVLRLNVLFPWQDHTWSLYESWASCEQYAPHVAALTKAYVKRRSEVGHPITLCETIRRCSWYLFEKSEYAEASAMIDQAISICEEAMSLGKETGYPNDWYIPRLVADLYSQKGAIAFEENQHGHGLEWHQRGREIRQQVLDNFDDETDLDAIQIRRYDNNIANALLANNMADEALDLLLRVYSESKSSNSLPTGDSHLPLNLSLCYQELGRFDEAAQMLDEAYFIIEPTFGKQSQQMSSLHSYRGRLMLKAGNALLSFESYSACFRILHRIMPNHPDMGYTCHSLGLIMKMQGQYEAARAFLLEATRILDNTDRPSLPAVRSVWMLSVVCEELGNDAETKHYRSRVISALEEYGLKQETERNTFSDEFFNGLVLYKWR